MVIIVRYGEIAIKGQNRSLFEKKLVQNIKDCLKKNDIPFESVKRERGRIIIYTNSNCTPLKKVYGIANFSIAKEVPLDLKIIKEEALLTYKEGSFRIRTKRIDKVFMTSQEIDKEVGAYVVKQKNAKVNLKKPDIEIGIEITKEKARIFSEKIQGLKGLPIGIEGVVAVILDSKEALTAGKLMMKRGCAIVLVKEKDIDWSSLKEFEYGFRIKEYNTIPEYVDAIVTAETFQTLKEKEYHKPVLRPLIAK